MMEIHWYTLVEIRHMMFDQSIHLGFDQAIHHEIDT